MSAETTDTETPTKATHSQAGLHRTSVIWLPPYKIKIIGIDTPHKSRAEHYLWDKRIHIPLKEEDIQNIATYGVKQPVLVEKDGEDYLDVDGRGRVRRARVVWDRQAAAGMPEEKRITVPCLPQRGDEVKMALLSRVANSGRTVDSAIDNAEFAQSLIDMGSPEADVACAFGVKVSTLKEWLVLLGLSAKVKAAVTRGQISASAAAGFAPLSKADQDAHLDELLASAPAGVKPSAEKVQNHVRNAQGKAPVNTPKVRVETATDLISKFAVDYPDPEKATKADLVALVEKLTKTITGKTMAKLAAAEAE